MSSKELGSNLGQQLDTQRNISRNQMSRFGLTQAQQQKQSKKKIITKVVIAAVSLILISLLYYLKQNCTDFQFCQSISNLWGKQLRRSSSKKQNWKIVIDQYAGTTPVFRTIEQKDKIVQKFLEDEKQFRIEIDFSEFELEQFNGGLSEFGIDKNIQIGSKLDYLNLLHSQTFQNAKKRWEAIIPKQAYSLVYDPAVELPQKYITTNYFNDYEQANAFFAEEGDKMVDDKVKLKFGIQNQKSAVIADNVHSDKVDQAEYLHYQQKYGIGNYDDEIPLCIFSIGYNVKSKQKYIEFFDSIQRQNYSNYRVVIIDDNSTDGTIQFFYELLTNSSMKVKNRVQLVQNYVRIGSVGNLYLRAKQFCMQDEIVVDIDNDDKFIGKQAFKVLNAVYRDPDVWFAYTPYFRDNLDGNSRYVQGLTKIPANHRLRPLFYTAHMKTYRKALLEKAPLQYYTEYHYNPEGKYLAPKFLKVASDRFMVYTLFELSQPNHHRYVSSALYYYYFYTFNKAVIGCYHLHQLLDEEKARLKVRLNSLESLSDTPKVMENNDSYSGGFLSKLSNFYRTYHNCENINRIPARRFSSTQRVNTNEEYFSQMSFLHGTIQNFLRQNFDCSQLAATKQSHIFPTSLNKGNLQDGLLYTDIQNQTLTEARVQKLITNVKKMVTYDDKYQYLKQSMHKCIVIRDFELSYYLLYSPQYHYFFIQSKVADKIKSQIEEYVQSSNISHMLQVSQTETGGRQFVVLEFFKQMKTTKAGFFYGNDKKGISERYIFSKILNEKLIIFYERERAKNVIDFGCGLCTYVKNLREAGIDALGVDGNPYTISITKNLSIQADLGKDFSNDKQYDWVQSFEVGQYIPKESTDIFLNNIYKSAKSGAIISWGNKKQNLLKSMNVLQEQQIVQKFERIGFLFDEVSTRIFTQQSTKNTLLNRILVFKKYE